MRLELLALALILGCCPETTLRAEPPLVIPGEAEAPTPTPANTTSPSSPAAGQLNIAPAPNIPITQADALTFCKFFIPRYYDLYLGSNKGLIQLLDVATPQVLHQMVQANHTLDRATVRQAKVDQIVPGSWRTVQGKPGIVVFQADGAIASANDAGTSGTSQVLPARWIIILARVNQISPQLTSPAALTWVETPQGRKGFPDNLCGLLLLKADLAPNK